MIHQYLFEREEDASHACEGWRREIMRPNLEIAGRSIWAGRSRTVRKDGRVVRRNAPSASGELSLTQRQIARWPHDTGTSNSARSGEKCNL